MRKLDEGLLKKVLEFIENGKGDIARLEHIKDTIKKGKKMYQSDLNYLEDLFSESSLTEVKTPSKESPDPEKNLHLEDSSKDATVDQLKEDLGNANKKIEKMEEKIEEQQKTTASMKNYKGEGTTLVLSIVVGLMGLMGVGHIYLGRVRRGIIILIVGLLIWTIVFIPMIMLGMLSEVEEDDFDMTAMIGLMGGFMIVGIAALALFIWQIFNARKLCKEYNEHLEEHGKPPW